jgi:carbamoyl-phosphate synthase large subunit
MHGIGNDYVYFNCMHKGVAYPERLAIRLSDRHFSIGADGVILIGRSKIADAKMRIFNADGSEGKTCGNGVRCVGKFLYDLGYTDRKEVTVETLAGVARLFLWTGADGKIGRVTADMGRASFAASDIPAALSGNVIGRKLVVLGQGYVITCVSMGNPHCVIFGALPREIELTAKLISKCGLFPQGVNVEFAEVISEREIRVRVYERGSGETLSCGSGACAVVSAAVANGYCRGGEDVFVRLRGGTLVVKYTKNSVYLTGDVALAFTGFVEV